MDNYKSLLGGYKDRVARVALFDLFNTVERKQKKDNDGKPIEYFGLYLLSLLFFFENMLSRNKKTGVKELSQFLKEVSQDNYQCDDEQYMEIARSLVEAMRPSAGKRNRRDFFNYETGEEDFVEYNILKVLDWDKEKNVQYYTLDEDGLELIFATKEYFSEFQISISQLILRKQLEKGEFSGALRQIDEMRINVNTIKEKVVNIKHDIQRNIVSDETYERYKEIVEDINRRLLREHEEFEEITTFVQETKRHYENDMTHHQKDHKAFATIIKIDNELMEVHNLHSSLLKESIELKTTALEAARESLYYVGLSSFNFDQEIVRKIMSIPVPLEESKLMSKPFLGMSKAKIWSPLSLFAKQRVQTDDTVTRENAFLDVEDEVLKKELVFQQKVFKHIFDNILGLMEDKKTIELKEVVNQLEQKMIDVRELYDFFIIMHQIAPVDLQEISKQEGHIFHTAFAGLPNTYAAIDVIECTDELKINNNYYVKNVRLSLIEYKDGSKEEQSTQ